MNFVMGTMFLVFPTVWVGALSWAGVRIGDLASAMRSGTQGAQKAGGSAEDATRNTVKQKAAARV